ncbi:MAG: hypothetical protein C4547_14130 [Phycisphaerales bacterium]|nr:MAG: hypothetical protein C4547_14130 [Phycisphaerales bacterium]
MKPRPIEVSVRRTRGGLIALVIGLLLWLWVWLMVMLGTPKPPKSRISHELAEGSPDMVIVTEEHSAAPDVRTAPLMLMFGLVLIILFVISSYVLIRGSRRFAASLDDRPAKPTEVTDIWSMHVVPEERQKP